MFAASLFLLEKSKAFLHERLASAAESFSDAGKEQRPDKSVSFGVLISTAWKPLCATFVVAVGISFMWGGYAARDYQRTPALIAMAVVSLALFLLLRRKGATPNFFHILYGIAFPIFALVFLSSLLFLVPGTTGVAFALASFLEYIASDFYSIVVIASLVSITFRYRIPSERVIALNLAINGFAHYAGKMLSFQLDEIYYGVILGVLIILYVIVICIDLVVNQMKRNEGASEAFHVSLSRMVSERYDLTSREEEVLSFLLQGKSYVGIAQALFVSPSTIKTHVKHIYTKLGVSSRDELIDILSH